LNEHIISDVRQVEIHIAEPLVHVPSPFEVEIVIAKLKNYTSPGSDNIPAELIQAGGETLWSENHKLANSVLSKEELPEKWNESYNFIILIPIGLLNFVAII
jgi:hypothetical protein